MRCLVASSIAFVTAFSCASAAASASATATATATATASASASASATAPASAPAVAGSLRVGFEVSARWFSFSDPLRIATNLRPYEAAFIPMLVLGGELRPLVWTRVPILRDLAIFGDYAFAPYLTSSITGGQDIQTSYERGRIALRLPVRFGRGEWAPRFGYGALSFDFQEAGALASEIPIVNYKMVRIGLDGRSRVVGPLSGFVSFEWLEPIEGGPLYGRFRDPSIGGIDTWLGVALSVAKGTELSLSVGYTRFFSSFEPVPGDPYVAGGALDEFGGLKLGIDYAP